MNNWIYYLAGPGTLPLGLLLFVVIWAIREDRKTQRLKREGKR